MAVTVSVNEPVWLKNARGLVGLKEIVGSKHEPKVLQFFAEAGHPEIHNDETAWCAAFANAMLRRAGYAGTGSLAARSFLTWGEKLATPKVGCIVVFKRGNSSWQGHVAFFLRDLGSHIEVLGGNQGNAVSVARYSKADLLGYRWPAVASAPAAKPKTTTGETAKAGGAAAVGAMALVGSKTAVDAGWGFVQWGVFAAVMVAVGVAAYFGWRCWQAREAAETVGEQGPAAALSMVATAKTRPVKPRTARTAKKPAKKAAKKTKKAA